MDLELSQRNCVRDSRIAQHFIQILTLPRSFSCRIEGAPHLRRGSTVRIIVGLRVTEIGRYEDTLEIRFSRVSNSQQFSVTRTIKAVVGDASYTPLLPKAPYVPRRRADRREVSDFVGGHPPPRLLAIAWRSKLGRYKIPKNLRETLSMQPNRPDTGEDIVPTEIRSLLPSTLRLKNHAITFRMLLYLEEIATEYVNYFDLVMAPN
jgi:helicase MOV-10